ncbi:4-alpha-glucanotransferase [Arthrobacter sp. zg-Y820]|uniref:4-alpha-glucanotransferase n=1 Tax=unclassified Arthrobacter TaxID=235627 RepID=UPI001E6002F9|nr:MULTISPECIES: 4-alpha-glucanotransferase [unclassified Arthrobacter]MCC9197089.1 4-alpha-glucanotransferase [Arthrobacter sp. zg-Y820]MDK1279954.1 4-alpha-glucanotransferase [Arthrobacter sp. zg.Y820]WIB09253.1 4-alpha-glucanotransferase [Arthrobacter sp. zg-Y820]
MTSPNSTDLPAESSTLLRELAAQHRVVTTFKGWDGTPREVSDETLRRVLSALGVGVESEEELAASLAGGRLAPWRQTLPGAVVVREHRSHSVAVHTPARKENRVWITLEDGNRREIEWPAVPSEELDVDGTRIVRTMVLLPDDLPLGWHRLEVEGGGGQAETVLVVTPERLTTTAELSRRRAWGLMAQLYSVRSSRSWGIGDLNDLADLAALSGADHGAGFILINPLHAAEPVPPLEPSPYLPATRRFFNPLYIRVEDIPEYGYLPGEARAKVEDAARTLGAANLSAEQLDRNSTYAAKLAALEDIFAVPRSFAREKQFEQFCALEGQGLENFALWCALTETLPAGAPEWERITGPDSPYVQEHGAELAARGQFYKWLQWICDQQLENVQSVARRAGMAIGVVHDLAVGVHPAGADAWMLRPVLAPGVSVGAPPDMFNQQGQDWSQPPWHPQRLADAGYLPYRDMLRTVLRHAGGIRVDHILGLFRQWWIPSGSSPGDGAYVHFDHEALIGILALEAERAGAVVIGEDLGVFEPWVQEYLGERGVLGTSILWFEQTETGPRLPEEYRQGALTTVNTHDLPPAAGYLAGEHVDLRASLGLLSRPVEEERELDAAAQEALLSLVRTRGLLADTGAVGAEKIQQTVEALHSFILQTPSVLLGVSLTDAVGERQTQNQPGTGDEYPNWRIPLCGPDGQAILLDDLPSNDRFNSLANLMQRSI